MHSQKDLILKKIIASFLLSAALFFTIIFHPQPSQAASGGRIGGGSFRTSPSPTIPRSGGYGGGYRGGPGSYGGYGIRGGGIGFPFLLPIFGFGGGGLFGFLILMSIVGVIVNSLRGSVNSYSTNNLINVQKSESSSVQIIQVQIGLLAKAKNLQKELRDLAQSADTNTASGLQRVLQDSTLSLLRQPELWVYANLEAGVVPFTNAEQTFNRLSINERSKLKAEITTNISGTKLSSEKSKISAGIADSTSEYIAVTVLLASQKKFNFKKISTCEELRDSLRIIGSISSTDIIATEIIWQPEGEGESLSQEDLITGYPHLRYL